MIPSVLIVENHPGQARAIARFLNEIPREHLEPLLIAGLDIETALNAQRALDLIRAPSRARRPIDVMFLDLGLPAKGNDEFEHPRMGINILKEARKLGAVREVVVVSVFRELEWVSQAYDSGIRAFVGKPYDRETIQFRFIESIGKILCAEAGRVMDHRIRTMTPLAENMLIYHHGLCFSGLLQDTALALEGVRSGLQDRFGIDPDRHSEDPLILRLADIQSAMASARARWAKLQSPAGAEPPHGVELKQLLSEVKAEVGRALNFYRAEVEIAGEEGTRVSSYARDVRAVLQELIVGPFVEPENVPAGRTGVCASISKADLGKMAEVVVEDNARPGVAPDVAAQVNEGFRIPADNRFGRAWGLSVAQHAAVRGGGSLTIEPLESGTRVRYRIPKHG